MIISNKNKKGFTLIELLVVISIISLLSSVVLSSLNSARRKAANSAIKENLANMRPQAEIIRSNSAVDSYITVCTNPNITAMRDAADSASGGTSVCNSSAGSWASSSLLKMDETVGAVTYHYWCVDSTGVSKGETSANPLGGVFVCP